MEKVWTNLPKWLFKAWEQPLLYFFIFQLFYCKKDKQDQIFEALGKPNGPKQNGNIKNEPVEIIKQRGLT